MDDSILTIYMIEEYIDFTDFENPIQSVINGEYITAVTTDHNWAQNIFLRRNEYHLDDDWLGFSKPKVGRFYNIREGFTNLLPSSYNYMFGLFVQMDSQIDTYEREVLIFSDIIGRIGGFFEIMEISLKVFMLYFVHKWMYHDILDGVNKDPKQKIREKK